jgi:DNA-binding transcriptional ArsR family regulator
VVPTLAKVIRDSVSKKLQVLSHPMRREILQMLRGEAKSFTEIQQKLQIESSHLSYHLRTLDGLVTLDHDHRYSLTREGVGALESSRSIGIGRISRVFAWSPKINYSLLLLAILFIAFATYVGSTRAQNAWLVASVSNGYPEVAGQPFIMQDNAGFIHIFYSGYDELTQRSSVRTALSTKTLPTPLQAGFQAVFGEPVNITAGAPQWVMQAHDGTFLLLYSQMVPPGADYQTVVSESTTVYFRTSQDGLRWSQEKVLTQDSSINVEDSRSYSLVEDPSSKFWLAYTSTVKGRVEVRFSESVEGLASAAPTVLAKYALNSSVPLCPGCVSQPEYAIMAVSRSGVYSVLWDVSTLRDVNSTYGKNGYLIDNGQDFTAWISQSTDGLNWSSPEKLPFGKNILVPWMTIAPNGKYILMWTDNRVSDTAGTVAPDGTLFVGKPTANLWVSQSSDGKQWDQPQVIAHTNGAPMPKVLVLSDGSYAVVSDGPGYVWFLLRGSPFDILPVPEFAMPALFTGISLFATMMSIYTLRRGSKKTAETIRY